MIFKFIFIMKVGIFFLDADEISSKILIERANITYISDYLPN